MPIVWNFSKVRDLINEATAKQLDHQLAISSLQIHQELAISSPPVHRELAISSPSVHRELAINSLLVPHELSIRSPLVHQESAANLLGVSPKAQFISSVNNMMLSNCRNVQVNILCHLFSIHCRSCYGSELWGCSSNGFMRNNTEWNKAARRVLKVPIYYAHIDGALVHCVVNYY